MLEQKLGQPVTIEEFTEIMKFSTDDIKFNRIGFKKKTDINEMLNIAAIGSVVLKRGKKN